MTPTLKPLPGELPPDQAAALDQQLDALRAASAQLVPRASMEADLLKQWQRRARPGMFAWLSGQPTKPAGGFAGLGQLGVPTAALALSLGFAGWMAFAPLLGQTPRTPIDAVASAPTSSDAPFIALQPMERIAMERDATVVSTTFPRALLANYGMPVSPERAGESVRADMLLSGSGQPLALRIIE